jgi:methylenetetrahydrofolate reductase (NADPH)
MEQAGIEYACEQIRGLVAQGVAGIHLYTMNKPTQTKQILKMAGLSAF